MADKIAQRPLKGVLMKTLITLALISTLAACSNSGSGSGAGKDSLVDTTNIAERMILAPSESIQQTPESTPEGKIFDTVTITNTNTNPEADNSNILLQDASVTVVEGGIIVEGTQSQNNQSQQVEIFISTENQNDGSAPKTAEVIPEEALIFLPAPAESTSTSSSSSSVTDSQSSSVNELPSVPVEITNLVFEVSSISTGGLVLVATSALPFETVANESVVSNQPKSLKLIMESFLNIKISFEEFASLAASNKIGEGDLKLIYKLSAAFSAGQISFEELQKLVEVNNLLEDMIILEKQLGGDPKFNGQADPTYAASVDVVN
jgi:hypothetical protein